MKRFTVHSWLEGSGNFAVVDETGQVGCYFAGEKRFEPMFSKFLLVAPTKDYTPFEKPFELTQDEIEVFARRIYNEWRERFEAEEDL